MRQEGEEALEMKGVYRERGLQPAIDQLCVSLSVWLLSDSVCGPSVFASVRSEFQNPESSLENQTMLWPNCVLKCNLKHLIFWRQAHSTVTVR